MKFLSFIAIALLTVFIFSCDEESDSFKQMKNPESRASSHQGTDSDGDGIGDYFDNCPNISNPNQLDTEPVGLKRSKIVEELSAMRSIEKV